MATGATAEVVELGIFGAGQYIPTDELSAGMVGYITASLKNVKDTQVGDTVTDNKDYESAVFFDNILHHEKGTIKSILKENMYEIYIRNMQKYRLVVIRDITAVADYEDFKAELTANIAHEIKTPVAIIMGAAETLINDDNIPADLSKKFLNKIYSGSNRLNNIICVIANIYT